MVMRYVLRGPTVEETPVAYNALLMRYRLTRGISIIRRQDGTYYTARYPSLDEILESSANYLGGHVYYLSDAEKDDLTSNGFGQYITFEDVPDV
jgi:hypothetical protein